MSCECIYERAKSSPGSNNEERNRSVVLYATLRAAGIVTVVERRWRRRFVDWRLYYVISKVSMFCDYYNHFYAIIFLWTAVLYAVVWRSGGMTRSHKSHSLLLCRWVSIHIVHPHWRRVRYRWRIEEWVASYALYLHFADIRCLVWMHYRPLLLTFRFHAY